MKKQDILVIVIVVVIGGMFSYFVSSAIFSSPKKRQLKVEVVDKISSEFPDAKSDAYKSFFNAQALNPTQIISIGGDKVNTQPFNNNQKK